MELWTLLLSYINRESRTFTSFYSYPLSLARTRQIGKFPVIFAICSDCREQFLIMHHLGCFFGSLSVISRKCWFDECFIFKLLWFLSAHLAWWKAVAATLGALPGARCHMQSPEITAKLFEDALGKSISLSSRVIPKRFPAFLSVLSH